MAMDSEWTVQVKIQYLDFQSRTSMEKAFIYHKQGLFKQCLQAQDKAIRSMITACYMKVGGVQPDGGPVAEAELFQVIRRHYPLDLNGVLLLSTACFVAQHYDQIIGHKPRKEPIRQLLHKVSQLLDQLSRELESA